MRGRRPLSWPTSEGLLHAHEHPCEAGQRPVVRLWRHPIGLPWLRASFSPGQAPRRIIFAMSPESPPAEKRRAPRARRFRQARCVFNNGASTLDVVVRDLSPLGARIAGDQLIVLPAAFEFRILDGFGGYSARKARIVWAKGATAGVEFLD